MNTPSPANRMVPAFDQKPGAASGANDHRFQAVFYNAAVGIALVAADGKWLLVNQKLCDLVGYTEAELLQLTFADITHPDDTMLDWEKARELLAGRISTYSIDKRYLTKSGEPVWVTLTVGLARSSPETEPYFVSVVQDISRKKQAEAEISASEARFRTLANSMPNLAWIANPDGWIFWYNDRWYEYTGTTPADMEGWKWQSVHDPNQLAAVMERWKTSIATGNAFEMIFPLRSAAGQYRRFLTRVQPLRNGEGDIALWFGTNTDVDEQERAADQIRESQERLNAALSASGTGTYRWEIESGKTIWDEALNRLFHLPPGDTNHTLAQFVSALHPLDRPAMLAACQECAQGRSDFTQEFRIILGDGSTRWIRARGKTFFNPDGAPAYMTGACVDITEHKALELALQQAQASLAAQNESLERTVAQRTESLQRAAEEMEEFSYTISHDLRAPLRAISGFAEIVSREVTDPAHQHAINRIIQSSRRMDQLILDVLTVSKATLQPLTLTSVDLDEVVSEIISNDLRFQPPAAEINLARPLGFVLAHPALLSQVLANLLGNATKFVSAGTQPRVDLSTVIQDQDLIISIKDNGIGVPLENQKKLFGIFQRVHSDQGYEGTGIGLSIVRKAATRMGGSVGMQSDGTNGSVFWVRLKRAVSSPPD